MKYFCINFKSFSWTNQFDIKFGIITEKKTQDNFYDSFILYFDVLSCCRSKHFIIKKYTSEHIF